MIKEDKLEKYQWHDWFAWHPVAHSEWYQIFKSEPIEENENYTHTTTNCAEEVKPIYRTKCVWLEKVERRATTCLYFLGIPMYIWEYRIKEK